MGLDIRFKQRRNVVCPHCKTIVGTKTVNTVDACGRLWYDILESFGYYVPYDKRTEEYDWYAKDMVLTAEQTKQVYNFLKDNSNVYNADLILSLIARAAMDEDSVVINADW